MPTSLFLPVSRKDMTALGMRELDILLISGDAYIDHPSFGTALLGRLLQSRGYRVGIVAQPRLNDARAAEEDIARMGRPRLFTGITAGAMDSMLAHYTAFRKKRSDDAYTPGGLAGRRPNRASIVYTGLVRRVFPGMPVVLGGIEASLRRIAHYDFWSNSLHRSLLLDAKADLLIYGMGEYALLAVAGQAKRLTAENGDLNRKQLVEACRAVPGLVWATSAGVMRSLRDNRSPDADIDQKAHGASAFAGTVRERLDDVPFPLRRLPSYEDMLHDKALLMRATLALERQVHQGSRTFQAHRADQASPICHGGYGLLQQSGDRLLVVTPPAPLPTQAELDAVYSLPFTRLPHPSYREPVPAWEMIRTGITSHRGCGGGCSFCSLALHQGRRIASRSRESILNEAALIAGGPEAWKAALVLKKTGDASVCREDAPPRRSEARIPHWAGAISDVGGPSADMWQAACLLPEGKGCSRSSCLHPGLCRFFKTGHKQAVALLREIVALPQVRHVRVASGVRFDLLLDNPEALKAYSMEFTGGQLKIAPEHSEDAVLELMRKPSSEVFERFLVAFERASRAAGKEQYTVPYLISAFPGCTEEHMRALAAFLAQKGWKPRQVQCFIPTPGTVATAMFYAGINPDGRRIYVARTDAERLRQHHLLIGSDPAGHAQRKAASHGQKRSRHNVLRRSAEKRYTKK